jgi:hypothetical protein
MSNVKKVTLLNTGRLEVSRIITVDFDLILISDHIEIVFDGVVIHTYTPE